MQNSKEELYNSTKNLVGVEHSTITMKNNAIKGEGVNMGVVIPHKDAVSAELLRQANVVETRKTIKDNDIERRQKMENETVNGQILVVGVGQGGGKNAHLAKQAGFATLAVNTAVEDTVDIVVDHIFIVKDAYGSGKERGRAKQKFVADSDRFLEEFESIIGNRKTVIVVHTSNGGTGAGIGPMLAKNIKDNYPDVNVFLITEIGGIKEDIKNQENAAGVIEEFNKTGVNYIVLDNDRAKLTAIDELYAKVNAEALTIMRAIAREYFVETNRMNMDLTDMQKIYMDNKRMVVVSGNFNRKVSGACNYEEQMIEAVKNSTQIGPCGSQVSAYGFFINVDEDLYLDLDPDFRAFQEIIGEPYETYKHLQTRVTPAGPDFTIFISGLDPVADRYALVNKRIDEFNQRRAANKSLDDVTKVTITGRTVNPIVSVPGESVTKRDKTVNKSAFEDFM